MQKCEFNSTKITLLYGHYSGNIQHICSKTPFLENTSGKLLLCTIFNIDVINVEVLHKQVKCYTGIKPCLTLNEIFIRPEAAIVVDKTRKRYGIYTLLVSELSSLRRTSHVAGCLVASQKDVYIPLGIQRVETISRVVLYINHF